MLAKLAFAPALETKYHHKSDSDAHLHGIAFCTKSRSLIQHINELLISLITGKGSICPIEGLPNPADWGRRKELGTTVDHSFRSIIGML